MTTTQTIATSPSDTGAECQSLLQTLTAKVTQLQGERQVLADLLGQAVGVIKTIDAEGTEEAEALAALVAFCEAAISPTPAPAGLDFQDSHPV